LPVGGQAGAHVKNYRVQYKDPHAGCKSLPTHTNVRQHFLINFFFAKNKKKAVPGGTALN